MTVIEPHEYEAATNTGTGWCTECRDFTTGCVEPDATDYECEACSQETVFGAEEALLQGMFMFEEDDSE